jgi:hypothetical protein
MDRGRFEITIRSLPSGSTMLIRWTSISVNVRSCAGDVLNAASAITPAAAVIRIA